MVVEVGENVRNLWPGDAVVTCISAYCGECAQCQHGHGHICSDKPARLASLGEARLSRAGQPVHQFCQLGAFAEEMLVHAHSVTKLPEGMPMDIAALLGCAVITGMGAVLHRAHVQPGETVAVIGCGGVGLNVVQAAKLAGASRIIAVDLNPAKLDLARVFGATDFILGGETAVAEVREMTSGGVDYAFEVIGLPVTMRQAFLMLRKRGAAVLIERELFEAGVRSGEFKPADPLLFYMIISGMSEALLDLRPTLRQVYGINTVTPELFAGYSHSVVGILANGILTEPDAALTIPLDLFSSIL
jgi:S-(hydroxymethyl)glutathione dehydrogenase/alcohol dehydrogenase